MYEQLFFVYITIHLDESSKDKLILDLKRIC